MNTPKLLPWYASKAGVSEERAAVLWRKAVRKATAETGWVGTSEYWGATMTHFQRLLEEERDTLCAPQVTALVRSQNRMWRLPLIAMEDMCSAINANWQRNLNTHRRAA
ncbi:hypothetical protein E6C76_13475 [Pseudothauera nasutitermitis]|uniref:Uncharacterized protein n=1 Tax=Pseudothauera nasutitermitis TaxID=2565930 RepID=A0A4V3WBL5_9RHOO|nr:hypothetical protein [Pseudothauera nasutitermitis]THF63603.1 hypothetical protein E6C76_13475 [Pseudothauera nasutitermitis]